MRTDKLAFGQIMQLPDWCFGRRYWTGSYLGSTQGTAYYHIAEEDLPDYFVVWGLLICNRSPSCTEAIRLTMRLGTFLPTNVNEIRAMDRVYKHISVANIVYEFYVAPNAVTYIPAERLLIESAGRRLTYLSNGDQNNAYEMTAGILISSLPKEVPDWALSGRAKSQK